MNEPMISYSLPLPSLPPSLPPRLVVCLEDRTSSPRGDYTWEKTKPETIEQRCQHGDDGMAKRECDRNGEWGVVNLDECDATVEDLFTYLDQVRW